MPLPIDEQRVYEHIGREIAQRRTSSGRSQADLARSIRLTRSSISNIEKGRQKMLVHTLLEIAASLDVPASALLPTQTKLHHQVFSGSELSSDDREQISAIVDSLPATRS